MTFVGNTLTKIFGSRNDRLLKRYRRIVAEINEREPDVRKLTDAQLRDRTQDLRRRLVRGEEKVDAVQSEALAIMRESMDRHIGIREIFNPERDFNPDRLDDANLERYDSVQRQMIATGLDFAQVEIPRELYDAVRELYPRSRPPFRARCFDVQLIGGLVLAEGKIAEMKTGEGKTFVAPLAAFLRAIRGQHTHVVTVNDYLVKRDASWVRPAFANLGMSVGYLQQTLMPGGRGRKEAYACDVTYGTNSEFGFDYLRDNMKERADLQVQGPLDFAIIDEVDSILIDEARTPLIISGEANTGAPKYREADEVARHIMDLSRPWQRAQDEVDAARRLIKAAEGELDKAATKEAKAKATQKIKDAHGQLAAAEEKQAKTVQYYEVEMDKKSVHLTHEGIAAAQEKAGVGSFYVGDNMDWPHLMEQAMRAHVVYERDKDYVVEINPKNNQLEVVIVDEYTGRKMVGRQWSDGLHQACEAKEKVPIKKETQTLATITLQNFFKLYKALAGMTGTAQTEAEEFDKIYKLDVVSIPTNRPVIRVDNTDLVYRTEPEKWDAILDDIKANSDAGRPVLVGTTSVEKSEFLSKLLAKKYNIRHEVLNAKQHERESHIVEHAGEQHRDAAGRLVGNVTIATNMAGRGTDIKPAASSFYDVEERKDDGSVTLKQRGTDDRVTVAKEDDLRYVYQVDEGERRRRRAARRGDRAAHGAADRRPAPRPQRAAGGPRQLAVLRQPRRPAHEDVHARVGDERPQEGRPGVRRADREPPRHPPDRRGAEEGRGAQLPRAKEPPGVRRGHGRAAVAVLRDAAEGPGGQRDRPRDLGHDRREHRGRRRPLRRPGLPGGRFGRVGAEHVPDPNRPRGPERPEEPRRRRRPLQAEGQGRGRRRDRGDARRVHGRGRRRPRGVGPRRHPAVGPQPVRRGTDDPRDPGDRRRRPQGPDSSTPPSSGWTRPTPAPSSRSSTRSSPSRSCAAGPTTSSPSACRRRT